MSQSADRVRGRAGAPASFGRDAVPEKAPEDFTIRGGEAIHVVVHAVVVPDEASLERLHEAIRTTTAQAVLAGYADAFVEMDRLDELAAAETAADDDVEQPGGGHGGAPSGT